MTPRSSQRARAREIYREMAGAVAGAANALTCTPTPNPSPHSSPDGERPLAYGRGEQSEQPALSEPDLTARVRALYESSAVPVREIAAMAGVTERTIYKYVEKGGWKRRYRVAPDFMPAIGAGGRFIRRADKGKPFARGLKATDPSGRVKALAACGTASRQSRRAQAKARVESRFEATLDAIDATNLALAALNRFRRDFATPAAVRPRRPPNPNEWPREEAKPKGRKKAVLPPSLYAASERAHLRTVEATLQVWQAFAPALAAGSPAVAAPAPAVPDPRYSPDDFRAWLPPSVS